MTIHERGYWLDRKETIMHQFDKPLSDAIVELFKDVKTVVDIGCGDGSYTHGFLNEGIDCIGFDGSPLTYDMTFYQCHIRDFSEPQNIGEYDLVLSLEVGEHIPAQYEQIFIDNICRAAKKHIVLSWAIEGQGGTGHVNCRNNDYIIQQIEKQGFRHLPIVSQKLRDMSTLPWFKNTLMVFCR